VPNSKFKNRKLMEVDKQEQIKQLQTIGNLRYNQEEGGRGSMQ
jgi:hypothetical protein